MGREQQMKRSIRAILRGKKDKNRFNGAVCDPEGNPHEGYHFTASTGEGVRLLYQRFLDEKPDHFIHDQDILEPLKECFPGRFVSPSSGMHDSYPTSEV